MDAVPQTSVQLSWPEEFLPLGSDIPEPLQTSEHKSSQKGRVFDISKTKEQIRCNNALLTK